MTGPLHRFDQPNSYIGRSVERADASRLVEGEGAYVDDLNLPRMVHAAFVRSQRAHAKINNISLEQAKALPGVVAVFSGGDINAQVQPYVGVLTHLQGLRSPPQLPMADEVTCWQGEPVVMVVAQSRAIAEDACELVRIDYEPLQSVVSAVQAIESNATVIHPSLDSNVAWLREIESGDIDAALSGDDVTTVERTFLFGRHTGVTVEPRSTVVEYSRSDNTLVFHYSGQAPHMMQAILAKHLDMPEENIRVVARDVGGSFGIKIHTYGDEFATAVAAKLLRRPVKFVADRLESFISDIHARDHRIRGRVGLDREGRIVGLEIDDLTGIGPYSMYPRTSAIECNQILNLTGAPYVIENYRAKGTVVFQNKNMMCQYRAVGHPVAMAVCDSLLEEAAAQIDMDVVEVRRRNLIADTAYPVTSATGMKFADLSHQKSLERLVELMNYDQLRTEQAALRERGVYRGIGLVSMVEVTNPSPMFYGVGGAPISAQDGATVRLDAAGALHVACSITESGQGTHTILAQIAAEVFGVDIARVKVTTGDTSQVPYGGGTWASRGAGIGGESVLLAASALKTQVLEVAASILQTTPDTLRIERGTIVNDAGEEKITLDELGRIVYYRGNELPADVNPELIATRHYRVTDYPFVFTNGAMAASVEVDIETGMVSVLDFWVVEDCGRVINPRLVDEQIRGGVVQGIGGALYEECLYDDTGQYLNATMADYLVPMAAEMPDIHIAHIETPTCTSTLGAKGAGEAGTGGAPAAILNAVNDALRPLNASIFQMPMTPERVLSALREA
jgi:carbon-monoxide dehydrogenase large subunit